MIMCDSEGALNAEPTENHQSAAAPLRSVLRFSVFQLIVLFSVTGLIIVDIRQINPLYDIDTEPSCWTSGRDQNGATRRVNTGLQFLQQKTTTTTNYLRACKKLNNN